MATTRNFFLPAIWGANANTVIPPNPIQGEAYRDATLSTAVIADGWKFNNGPPSSAEENQGQFLQSSIIKEVDTKGVAGWTDLVDYDLVNGAAYVRGSNGDLYRALLASGPAGVGAKDPLTEPTFWKLFGEGATQFYTDSGIADAYNLTAASPFGSGVSSYHNGLIIKFAPQNRNTGASTAKIGALAALPIVDIFGDPLTGSEMLPSRVIELICTNSATQWLYVRPADSARVSARLAGPDNGGIGTVLGDIVGCTVSSFSAVIPQWVELTFTRPFADAFYRVAICAFDSSTPGDIATVDNTNSDATKIRITGNDVYFADQTGPIIPSFGVSIMLYET